MSKEGFIKSHSYVLTAVGLLTAGVVLYQNKDPLQNVIRKYINKQTPQEQVQVVEVPKFPQLDLPQEAAEILKKDKALVCSYHNGWNSYQLYVSDKHLQRKIKEFVTINPFQYHEHTFVECRTVYRWNNTKKQGYAFFINEELAPKLFDNLRVIQKPAIQKPGVMGHFKCERWKKVDESVFGLPSNIVFVTPPSQSNPSEQSQQPLSSKFEKNRNELCFKEKELLDDMTHEARSLEEPTNHEVKNLEEPTDHESKSLEGIDVSTKVGLDL